MERVSQILQLPIIVEWSWPPLYEPQPFQKLDFLAGGIAAERSILEELLKARLYVEGPLRFPFDELKSPRAPKSQSAV